MAHNIYQIQRENAIHKEKTLFLFVFFFFCYAESQRKKLITGYGRTKGDKILVCLCFACARVFVCVLRKVEEHIRASR